MVARFDTLFTERRHFRSDCKLVQRAIRQGWIEERDIPVLLARLQAALTDLQTRASGSLPREDAAATQVIFYAVLGEQERVLDLARALNRTRTKPA